MTADNDDPRTPMNGGSRPIPDPTVLTDAAIARLEKSLIQYIDGQLGIRDERLSGIDEATKLRLSTVTGLPDQIESAVAAQADIARVVIDGDRRFVAAATAHQREISDIRFQAAQRLAERESELNALALAAAFAAQKEASAKEAEYTRIASNKQETGTAEAINKLGELFNTRVGGVEAKVDDVRTRMTGIENRGVGTVEQRADARANATDFRGWIAAAVGLGAFLVLLFTKLAP